MLHRGRSHLRQEAEPAIDFHLGIRSKGMKETQLHAREHASNHPLLSVKMIATPVATQQRSHFVSPLGAADVSSSSFVPSASSANGRHGRVSRQLLGQQQQQQEDKPKERPKILHPAHQIPTARLLAASSPTNSNVDNFPPSDDESGLESPQVRLTVPHLPFSLSLPSNEYSASESTTLSTRMASVPPDASVVFANFDQFVRRQRADRAQWYQQMEQEREAEIQRREEHKAMQKQLAMERAEKRKLASVEKATARREARLERKRKRHAVAHAEAASIPNAADAAEAELIADETSSPSEASDVTSASGSDNDNDPRESSPETQDALALMSFSPSVYSYPRLQFDAVHVRMGLSNSSFHPRSSQSSSSTIVKGNLFKLQTHVSEVTSLDELQQVWKSVEQMVHQHQPDNQSDLNSRDAIIRDKVFAFEIQSTDPVTGEISVSNGFDDGKCAGSGSKLLNLMRSLGLTNIFVLVTESGAASRAPLLDARQIRNFQANLLKCAKIQLQDLARIKSVIEGQESENLLIAQPQISVSTNDEKDSSADSQLSSQLSSQMNSPTNGGGWQTDRGSNLSSPAANVANQSVIPTAAAALSSPPSDAPSPRQLNQAQLLGRFANDSPASPDTPQPPMPPPLLTAMEEELLKAEYLSLLSGHAFLKLSPANLCKEGGRLKPYFMPLWQAYLTRLHPQQEHPQMNTIEDTQMLPHTARHFRALNRIDANGGAVNAIANANVHHAAGKNSNKFQLPRRIEDHLQSLSMGTSGLMLDGFPSDPKPDRSSRSLNPLAPHHPPASEWLTLRAGAGQAGQASFSAPSLRKNGAQVMREMYDRRLKGLSSQQDHSDRKEASQEPDSAPANAPVTFWELAERESFELSTLTSRELLLAKRKSMLQSSHEGIPTDPRAQGLWLEVKRIQAIRPSHSVQSHKQIFLQLLLPVYLFKSKFFLMRLSRLACRKVADDYPTAPPLLVRLLILCVGILLKLPNLQWKVLRHYLRGEVPLMQLNPFLATDQASWRLYLAQQENECGGLPPMLSPEKLATSIFEREKAMHDFDAFLISYQVAASFGINEAGAANPPVSNSAKVDELVSQAPRDFLAHLMGMDVMEMSQWQYDQVLTLLNEPTLCVQTLHLLPEPLNEFAVLLFEWVLLTMRTYNVWVATKRAFEPQPRQHTQELLAGYQQYIKSIGLNSEQNEAMLEMAKKHQEEEAQQRLRIERELMIHEEALEQERQRQLAIMQAELEARALAPPARIKTYTKPPVPRQASRVPKPSASQAAITAVIATITTNNDQDSPGASASTSRPSSAHGTSVAASAASSRPVSRPTSASSAMAHSASEFPAVSAVGGLGGLASQTLRGNLSTLLSSERPSALPLDETMANWLVRGQQSAQTSRFGRAERHWNNFDDAPPRRMG